MAYSIYAYLDRSYLESDVFLNDSIVSEFFRDEYTRVPTNEGPLFFYCKPRGDRHKENQLFSELQNLHTLGLLIGITSDDYKSERPLAEKLANYPDLHQYISKS